MPDLRTLLLERSRETGTANGVVDAIFAGIGDPKIKIGDAIKLYELLLEVQSRDTEESPFDDDIPDFSRYTDEQLRAFLRIPDHDFPTVPEDHSGNHSPQKIDTESSPEPVHINLEDILYG